MAATAVGMRDLVLAHTKPAAILAEAPDGTKARNQQSPDDAKFSVYAVRRH